MTLKEAKKKLSECGKKYYKYIKLRATKLFENIVSEVVSYLLHLAVKPFQFEVYRELKKNFNTKLRITEIFMIFLHYTLTEIYINIDRIYTDW